MLKEKRLLMKHQKVLYRKKKFCIHLVVQEHYRYDHSHYYSISYFPDSHDLSCIDSNKYQHGGCLLLGSDLAWLKDKTNHLNTVSKVKQLLFEHALYFCTDN